MKYAVVVVAALLGAVSCAHLNPTEQKYASIGLDTLSCASTCGIQAAAGAIEGTASGDAALTCLTRCAAQQGFKVISEVFKDVVTGATGGGWFGSAEERPTHTTVYKVRVVKVVE